MTCLDNLENTNTNYGLAGLCLQKGYPARTEKGHF